MSRDYFTAKRGFVIEGVPCPTLSSAVWYCRDNFGMTLREATSYVNRLVAEYQKEHNLNVEEVSSYVKG